MFINYLKIAIRNIWKYKIQSITAIFGLAFAIACFAPALYWMRYETSYDCFYSDAKRIYRVYSVEKSSGKVNNGASKIVERKMREQFPAIEASTSIMTAPETCRTDKIPYVSMAMLYADSSFFSVFPQTIICGDTKAPLQVLNNMILTESMAVRLFGDVEKAIGQQVQNTIRKELPPYVVTAVVKDPPQNTNLSFDAIIFHDMLRHFSESPEDKQWQFMVMDVFAKFNPQANLHDISEQMRDLASRLGTNPDIELRMMPVSDVRHNLNSDVPFTLNFIGLFVASGILLLLTAIFNFLNLHFDLFRQRNREFYLRSVNGATNGQLIWQMIFELFCSVVLSLLLAGYLVVLVRPYFSELLNIKIEIPQLISLFVICGIAVLILMLLVGFILFARLSYLSTRHFSEQKRSGEFVLRRIAVMLQLAVSMIFIIAASVVMLQLHFVNHKDLGFNRDGIIQLTGFMDYSGKVQTALINELKTIPQIDNIADANFEPQKKAHSVLMITSVEWEGKPLHEKPAFQLFLTDSRFAEIFRLKMLKGKWWDEGQTRKIVLNEEAVRVMGLSNPVGSIIRLPSTENESVLDKYEVVGVVNDFHTLSFRNRISPTVFIQTPQPDNTLYIHTTPGQEVEVMRRINAMLPHIDPTLTDVQLTPIGELYDRLNQSEQVGLKMFSVLAIVCLLISLFGIYAVSANATQKRRKEIAIRKVAGANAGLIVRMFFREYILQVIIAGAFALPLAYLVMNNWLQGYAYRTNIPWWLLIGVITCVIIVVLLTVLGQVLKAANGNPADVVKSE